MEGKGKICVAAMAIQPSGVDAESFLLPPGAQFPKQLIFYKKSFPFGQKGPGLSLDPRKPEPKQSGPFQDWGRKKRKMLSFSSWF